MNRDNEKIINKKREPVTDHKGRQFKNKSDMSRYYNLKVTTFYQRINRGWTLQKALETPTHCKTKRIIYDHDGKKFDSVKTMCAYHNVSVSRYKKLISQGASQKTALTRKFSDTWHDHLGNKYRSLNEMAEAYGFSKQTLSARLNRGWKIEKALTTPVENSYGYKNNKKCLETT